MFLIALVLALLPIRPEPCGGHAADIADHPDYVEQRWYNNYSPPTHCPNGDGINPGCANAVMSDLKGWLKAVNDAWREKQCQCWAAHPDDPVGASLCMDEYEDWMLHTWIPYLYATADLRFAECCGSW